MAKRKATTRTTTKPRKPAQATNTVIVQRIVKAKYDAAQTTHDNARHWAAADGLSAAAANSYAVRAVLRKRSRYEVANNGIASGIVSTLVNDVIGTGPRLTIQTGDRVQVSRMERTLSRWADEINLSDKLRTMRRAKAVDGEAFAVMVTNPVLMSPIKLDLRLVEADQISDPLALSTASYGDGIGYDASGNPAYYRVLNVHPGDVLQTLSPLDYDDTPARDVIHWYNAERPGQLRGIPEIVATLGLFAELRRYTLAVIAAAETAADFAWFLKTNSPEIAGASATPFDTVEIERRMGQVLPAHWDVSQLKAEQPTTTYGDFRRNIINEAARPLNMPYNVAACDSSSYNYASGRLDHQVYHRAIGIDREQCERRVLDRVLYAWLNEAALVPGLIPDGMPPFAEWDWGWRWPGFEHVDPTKEATASASRLATHTTTLREEYAARGLDWQEQLRQRASELQLMSELGIPLMTPSGAVVGDQQGAATNGQE